jgi:hypothetical protein
VIVGSLVSSDQLAVLGADVDPADVDPAIGDRIGLQTA